MSIGLQNISTQSHFNISSVQPCIDPIAIAVRSSEGVCLSFLILSQYLAAYSPFCKNRNDNYQIFHALLAGGSIRDRPRFFDQVGHQTTNASI